MRVIRCRYEIADELESIIPRDIRRAEGYSGGGLEGIECECRGDGLLECFQGSAVGRVEDSPGLDVGDGPLDDLADPVDAPVLLLRGFAQFSVGRLLMGRDHSPSDIALVADPSGVVDSLEQSGGVQCGHVVHGPRAGVRGPHEPSVGPDQDLDVHARAPVLDRPRIAAPAPVRAGEEGAVHHDSRSPRAPPPR